MSEIVAVTDHRMERILRRVGVPWRRIHHPLRIGNAMAVAGFTEVSAQLLEHLCAMGGLQMPILGEPLLMREIA